MECESESTPVDITTVECACCGLTKINVFEGVPREDVGPLNSSLPPHQLMAMQRAEKHDRLRLRELDIAIERLKKIHNDVSASHHYHRSWSSPINRAPDDILFSIFSQLVLPRDATLWSITAVCRRWRTLGVGHPQLWTQVTYGYTNHTLAMHRSSLQLERSQSQMLHLNWKSAPKNSHGQAKDGATHKNEAAAFDTLLRHAHRFKSIYGFFDCNDTIKVKENTVGFVNLETLGIFYRSQLVFWADGPLFEEPALFSQASNVTAVALQHMAVGKSILPNLANLRYLKLNGMKSTPVDLLDFLSSTPNLIELHLLQFLFFDWYSDGEIHAPSADRMVTLSHLIALILSFTNQAEKYDLDHYQLRKQPLQIALAHLHAPNLEILTLDSIGGTLAPQAAEYDVGQTLRFLQKSNALKLKQLIIRRPTLSASRKLAHLLAALPALEHLVIDMRDTGTTAEIVVKVLISALTPPSSSTTRRRQRFMVPQLQHLSLTRTEFSLAQLTAMILSRLRAGQRGLQRVSLCQSICAVSSDLELADWRDDMSKQHGLIVDADPPYDLEVPEDERKNTIADGEEDDWERQESDTDSEGSVSDVGSS